MKKGVKMTAIIIGILSYTASAQSTVTKDLTLTRVFEAPVGEVWKAWTASSYVQQWWSPTGFTTPVANMDVRVGGTSLVCMRSPDGMDFCGTWTYLEILPNERLEFVMAFSDKEGNKVDPTTLGLPPDMQKEVRHVITFKSLGENKTEMTITEFGYTSDQNYEMSKAGLEQALDKMKTLLEKI